MTTRPTYGFLLLSFSRHSHQRSFVPLYQSHPRTRIVAVADEDADIEPYLRELNRRRAAELGVPYFGRVDDALERRDVDVVSVAHEIERRADLALRSARAGKHLWIDKFIGATIDECDAVVAGVRAAGVRAIVPSYAYGSLVEHCRSALARGAIGDLLGVHVDLLFAKGWPRKIDAGGRRPFQPPGRWKFPDVKRELLTVGAYAVGLVQACLDPIVGVAGHADAYFFPEHAAHGVEDFGTLSMTDAGGRLATICGGRVGVATDPAGGPARAFLVGAEGTAIVDARQPAVRVFLRDDIAGVDYRPAADDPMQWASGPPSLSAPLAADATGLAAALDDLVAALDEERTPAYSVADARDNMEVLLAGYHSAVHGDTVDLPLPRRGTTR